MKIAIVGSGFAGLALSYFLVEAQKKFSITLFDPNPLGGNASNMAVGLMHPYMGIFAKKSFEAEKAMEESIRLFRVAEKEIGSSVFSEKGVFRPLVEQRQESSFLALAEKEPFVSWWDAAKVEKHFGSFLSPGCVGIFLEKGVLVESKKYVRGLLQFLEKQGVKRVFQKVNSLKELSSFDKIAVCSGEHSMDLVPSLSSFLQKRRGQVIEGNLPCKPLFCPVLGRGHITFQGERCFLGSTYETMDTSEEESTQKREELLIRIEKFFPSVKQLEIKKIWVGTRLFQSKSYLPYIGFLDEKTSVLTALGSRGLLYHAFFAKKLAKSWVQG